MLDYYGIVVMFVFVVEWQGGWIFYLEFVVRMYRQNFFGCIDGFFDVFFVIVGYFVIQKKSDGQMIFVFVVVGQ